MLVFLEHPILTAVLLLLVANLVRGVHVQGWGSALVGALVLGFVNAVVRPLMVLLTLPFTILTFGLFLLVVNALMLWLVAELVPGIRVQGPHCWGAWYLRCSILPSSFSYNKSYP